MDGSRLLTTVELRQLACKDLRTTTTGIYLSTSITNATTSKRVHHHLTQIGTGCRRSVEFADEIRFLLSNTHQEIINNIFYLEIELCSPTIFSKDKVIGKVTVPINNLLRQSSQGILNYQITSVKNKKERGILTFFFKITNNSPQGVEPIPKPSPITPPSVPPAPLPEPKPDRVTSGFYPSVDASREQLYGPIPPPSPVSEPHRAPPPIITAPDTTYGCCSPQVLPFHLSQSTAYYGGLTPPQNHLCCVPPVYFPPPPPPAYYYGSSTPTCKYYGDNCYYSHRGY